jgi:hypothetical protein
LAGEVRARVREQERGRALRGVLILLRYHPRGLPLLLLSERRMQRRRPIRRLEALVRELEVREGRLKESEGAREEESGSALARERHEVQLLKKRIRRLRRRTQNLDRWP